MDEREVIGDLIEEPMPESIGVVADENSGKNSGKIPGKNPGKNKGESAGEITEESTGRRSREEGSKRVVDVADVVNLDEQPAFAEVASAV
ncbi:MAG: hypothetical protein IT452_05185 [Planctomycetia bacterium]|nr:hypothetical protein [Planctomycetia bacterium]